MALNAISPISSSFNEAQLNRASQQRCGVHIIGKTDHSPFHYGLDTKSRLGQYAATWADLLTGQIDEHVRLSVIPKVSSLLIYLKK